MNLAARVLASIGAGLQSKAYWGDGDWVSSNRPGNRWSSGGYSGNWNPGTNINYSALAGDLWTNSAVQACLNALIRAWPESYPCVKQKDASGKKIPLENHPLTAILDNPNEFDDDTVLWAATIVSYWCDGNGYWRINRTRGNKIAEFEFVPHYQICPMRELGSTNPGPDYYRLSFRDRPPIELDPWDVVHFRFGKDPYNDLLGMSAWASVAREVYTDNEAVNYTATTLRNGGAAWMIVSPASPDAQFDKPETVKDLIESTTTGDNRSRVLVFDGSMKADFPPSMKDNAVDTLRRIPETRICAMAGLPAMWVGLAAGLERSTFSNTDQAATAAWQTIVAVQRMMGRQLTKQVLWDKHNYAEPIGQVFAGFDYSEVRALQPDKAVEWERIREQFKASLLTDDEARVEMGYEAFTTAQRSQMLQQAQEAAQAALPPAPEPGQQDKPPPSKEFSDEFLEKFDKHVDDTLKRLTAEKPQALLVGELLAEIAAKSSARAEVYEEMFDVLDEGIYRQSPDVKDDGIYRQSPDIQDDGIYREADHAVVSTDRGTDADPEAPSGTAPERPDPCLLSEDGGDGGEEDAPDPDLLPETEEADPEADDPPGADDAEEDGSADPELCDGQTTGP